MRAGRCKKKKKRIGQKKQHTHTHTYVKKNTGSKKKKTRRKKTKTSAKKTAMEGQKFAGGEEYLISGLELKPKKIDLTKWNDFDKIKKMSDIINEAKQKKENEVEIGQIMAGIHHLIAESDEFLPLETQPPHKKIQIYKFRDKK